MEAALCELQEMNNIFLNQTEVEDKMIDLPDLKGQAGIEATETELNYDDLTAWIKKLDAADVVSGNELALFPELEEQTNASELSQCYMEEFIHIEESPVKTTEGNLHTNPSMVENFDLAAFLQLDKGNIDEEVATASKLLSTEELQLADTLISYVEGDSNVSSPEMNHQSVDALLDELLGTSMETGASADVPNDCANTSRVTCGIEPSVQKQDITVDCEFDPLSDELLDEKVINEFANLLNSLDDSFDWAQLVPTVASDSSSDNVDTNNADIFTTIEHSDVQCIQTNIEESFTIPCNTVEEKIPCTTTVRKQKRKRTDTVSDEEQVEKKVSRRLKNNEASKVTRAKRRSRHQELFDTERQLTENNAELRIKLEVMQKEADILRQLLVVALNNSNKY